MARTGVTYEQVSQAADALLAAGQVGPDGNPTIAGVRERLGGTGSPNTIHGHLQRWKGGRPARASAGAELPAGIVRAITDELARAHTAARAEIEAQLAAAQQEASGLARSGAQLEEELTTARELLATAIGERDRLQGQLDEQIRAAARLSEALSRERETSETVRVELAQARLKTEAADAAALALRDERAELQRLLEVERAAHIDAARKLASAEAARDELRQRAERLTADADELDRECDRMRDLLDQEREQHGTTRSALAAEQEKARAAEKRAEDLHEREASLRKELADTRRQPSKAAKDDKPGRAGRTSDRE